jgi:diketogulonate reductase-like aldo/keto reductase
VAVIANRPLFVGELVAKVRGRPLPAWAAELGWQSWSQFFLKYILGHPAVTCVIPATRTPAHMAENLEAGTGKFPDQALRKRMTACLAEM